MIQVRNISKEYGRRQVLNNISFDARDGEIVGLLGVNGAGKSTLMNIMTGYISADSGDVLFDGLPVSGSAIAVKKLIGTLGEIPSLYVDMTVDEQLSFVFDLKKLRGDKEAQIAKACDAAGISHVRARRICNLSKGYRQRVGLAQAVLGDAKNIFLDEPTVGLDPRQMVEMRALIKQLRGTRTVIISSHLLNEISSICDRVIIIDKGAVVADDTPARLCSSNDKRTFLIAADSKSAAAIVEYMNCLEEVRECRDDGSGHITVLTENGADVRQELLRFAVQIGADISSLSERRPSLEDVFVRLTDTGSAEERSDA